MALALFVCAIALGASNGAVFNLNRWQQREVWRDEQPDRRWLVSLASRWQKRTLGARQQNTSTAIADMVVRQPERVLAPFSLHGDKAARTPPELAYWPCRLMSLQLEK